MRPGNLLRNTVVSLDVTYVLVAVLVLAAGCGGGTHFASGTVPVPALSQCALSKTFTSSDVRFDYPTCWTAGSYSETSSFSSSIVDLGNQATHNPCHPASNGTSCVWPIDQLAPGHALVRWSANGFPGWTLDRAPGTATTVAGRPAREAIARPGGCADIGADETITVAIARPGIADNWFGMTACVRSPGDAEAASQVQQMLSTVSIAGS